MPGLLRSPCEYKFTDIDAPSNDLNGVNSNGANNSDDTTESCLDTSERLSRSYAFMEYYFGSLLEVPSETTVPSDDSADSSGRPTTHQDTPPGPYYPLTYPISNARNDPPVTLPDCSDPNIDHPHLLPPILLGTVSDTDATRGDNNSAFGTTNSIARQDTDNRQQSQTLDPTLLLDILNNSLIAVEDVGYLCRMGDCGGRFVSCTVLTSHREEFH